MVVNSKGRACTQRVDPRLALVETELPNEAMSEGWEPNKNSYLGNSVISFFFLSLQVKACTRVYSDLVFSLEIEYLPFLDCDECPLFIIQEEGG